jgi:DNA-binding ferritin-like protein
MIGQFIAVLFLARDLAHREHLRTTGPGSFARHEALGEFYPAVVDLADTLAETYQGSELTLIDIPLLDNEFPGEIKESMQAQAKWIKSNRYKAVKKEDTHMQNIIDEIVALYDRTIFKLHFMK